MGIKGAKYVLLLLVMFLQHRMRTFQGAFHANPDYAFWYGWSAMQMDLTEIKNIAAELQEKAKKKRFFFF